MDDAYGVALVVEDDGPRLVYRYCNRPGHLLDELEASAVAKLFCTKRALRGVVLELEIDDVLFLSCPTTIARAEQDDDDEGWWSEAAADSSSEQEEAAVFDSWGDEVDGERGASRGELSEETKRLGFFNVVWACPRRRGLALAALKATARDVTAGLAYEESRCGYVSREAMKLLAEHDGLVTPPHSAHAASGLAAELRAACDLALGRGDEGRRVRLNGWIEVCCASESDLEGTNGAPRDSPDDDSSDDDDDDLDDDDDDEEGLLDEDELDTDDDDRDVEFQVDDEEEELTKPRVGGHHHRTGGAAKRGRGQGASLPPPPPGQCRRGKRHGGEAYAPYEALVLTDRPERILAGLPAAASPQLSAIVAASSPSTTFAAVAARTGLPLERVSHLAGHLVRWRRARVVSRVLDASVYRVAELRERATTTKAPRGPRSRLETLALSLFGPARTVGDAVRELATILDSAAPGQEQATPDELVFSLISDGSLRPLHTYVHRLEGAPSPDLEAAAADAVRTRRRESQQQQQLADSARHRGAYYDDLSLAAAGPLALGPGPRAPESKLREPASPPPRFPVLLGSGSALGLALSPGLGAPPLAAAAAYPARLGGGGGGAAPLGRHDHALAPLAAGDDAASPPAPPAAPPPLPSLGFGGAVAGTRSQSGLAGSGSGSGAAGPYYHHRHQPHHHHHHHHTHHPAGLVFWPPQADYTIAPPPRQSPGLDAATLLHLFNLLSPYFDGRHSTVDMAFKTNLTLPTVTAVLHTFRSILVTIQR